MATKEAYFIFKGQDSREFGILISAMPAITKPQRRGEEITIPGRNGSLTIDEGTYENYSLSMECGKRGRERMDEMLAWLDGSGELILSTEPDKVYKAQISNAIPISDVVYLYNSFFLDFRVFPFKYSVNAFGDKVSMTKAFSLYNNGTIYSQPKITVFGAGNITLSVNGEGFPLKGVADSITIDSELMEVYKGSLNCNNQYGAMEFPRLAVGKNEISWTGSVTKVEVEPRWRWL